MRNRLAAIALLLWFAAAALWAQATFAGNVTATGAVSAQLAEKLFENGFEEGDCSEWSNPTYGCDGSDLVDVNTNVVHSDTYSLEINYNCGGSGTLDRFVTEKLGQSYAHAFVRSYVYMKEPEGGADATVKQRKLIELGDNLPGFAAWAVVIDSFSEGTGSSGQNINMSLLTQAAGQSQTQEYNLYEFHWGNWYSVEVELALNSVTEGSGNEDGTVRIWVNGSLQYEDTSHYVNGDAETGLQSFAFGRQGDCTINEYRYWDDAAISTVYLGP